MVVWTSKLTEELVAYYSESHIEIAYPIEKLDLDTCSWLLALRYRNYPVNAKKPDRK